MEDALSHLLLAPDHLDSLKQRFQNVIYLKQDITHTIRSFEQYIKDGRRFCASTSQLAESFCSYRAFEEDSGFQSISHLITHFAEYFTKLFDQVELFVLERLRLFLKGPITSAEITERSAAHELDSYLKAIDLHAALPKKKITDTTRIPLDTLSERHLSAAEAHLSFDQALLQVERQIPIEVSETFLMFISFAKVAFEACCEENKSASESFAEMRAAFPVSVANVGALSLQEETQKTRLKACHEEYWRCRNQSFIGSSAILHAGYLWKKGHGITKSWQRRFFQIRNDKLSYQHDETDTGPARGAIDLTTVSCRPHSDPDRVNCFLVISPFLKNHYILQALTQYDANEWQTILQNNIQYLLDRVPTSDDPESVVEKEKRFDPRETNKSCADCGVINPSWCCLNWGTCICIKCAGVHREMSTHVSKVRSLTLDHLEEQLLTLFRVIGNDYANEVLTQNVPPNTQIGPELGRNERTELLRRKYMACEFVDTSTVVDIEKAIEAGNVKDVFRGLCQMRKLGQQNDGLLRLAAAIGQASVCLLVGLNTKAIDSLDEQGWSPLSYAAWNGNLEAANALLLVGCDPRASVTAHPYTVAVGKKVPELITLFLPYRPPPSEDEPLIAVARPLVQVARIRAMRRDLRLSTFDGTKIASGEE